MILFIGIAFFVALILLVLLFALKLDEERTGRKIAARVRESLDKEALHLKALLAAAQLDLKKVPPLLLHWTHVIVHRVALEFARAARAASRRAHALADFVSHKRNFQRRATRSEFLKKVSERKSGVLSGNGQDGFSG